MGVLDMRHLVGARGRNRIRAIDPLRGFAMLLAIAQHAYHLIDPERVGEILNLLVYTATRMASVAFMTVSGMMIGYFLYSGRPADEVVRRFRRRALFLLAFAHPAIHLAYYFGPQEDRWGVFWSRIFFEGTITDTIALSLLVSPLLLLRLRPRAIAALALALVFTTPVIVFFWPPTEGLAQAIKIFLFGRMDHEPTPISMDWPLVPWVAIFLCGSLAGRMLADARTGQIGIDELVRRLLRAGAWLAVPGVVYLAGYKALRFAFTDVWPERVFQILWPTRTTGLLPLYLAVLCGVLAFLLWRLDLKGRIDRASWALSVFGRTSLFTYVAQFVFVFSVPGLFGWKGELGLGGVISLAIFATVCTWILAYAYGRARGWIGRTDYRDQLAAAGDSPLVRGDASEI
jgi:uncharacterized membrane protein